MRARCLAESTSVWSYFKNTILKIVATIAALQAFAWVFGKEDDVQKLLTRNPDIVVIVIVAFAFANYIVVDLDRRLRQRYEQDRRSRAPRRRKKKK